MQLIGEGQYGLQDLFLVAELYSESLRELLRAQNNNVGRATCAAADVEFRINK
ncbi:MAG TPA: hypothetical protein VK603_00350 [Candidatus Saccharimonadales bacterium]|nr:hypothetical protein [Candidatus Saccharimonadales bacterium]